jgi:hypothetical protein
MLKRTGEFPPSSIGAEYNEPLLSRSESLRDRIVRSRLGRAALALVAATSFAAGGALAEASSASAEGQPWDQPTTSEHGYIDYVVWADTPEGKSLHAHMTPYGKMMSWLDPARAFNEVQRDAHLLDDNPLTGSLEDQFDCHAELAPPTKSSWNLDTWRPDPGVTATMNDQCNPGEGGAFYPEGIIA